MYLKEGRDSGDSVVLVEEKEEGESDELYFCYSYFWKYY